MRKHAVGTLVFVVLATPLTASAQSRPVEIGAGAGGATTWAGDMPGVHITVTCPLDDRWAIEPIVAVGRQNGNASNVIRAIYGAQTRFRLDRASRDNFETFLTFGAVGMFERETYPEVRYDIPGGRPYVQPARTETSLFPPLITVAGIGIQQRVAAHLALRADVQAMTFFVIPGGLRAAAGVTVPIGHFTRSTRWRDAR